MLPGAVALLGLALAGCQGATVAPTPAVPATATPGITASPTSSAGPAPTSAAATARAVLDGLRAFAADDARTYRVTFKGDSRHTTDILAVKGTLDVSGDDAALTATFDFPREGTGRTDYRRVGTKDWLRIDKGRWRALNGVDVAAVVDPFAGTHDGTRMQYLGPVEGKPDRFRVQLGGMFLHPALIPAYNLTDEAVKSTQLVLVTDATGHPVSGTWSMRGRGRVSGQLQAIAIDLDLTFSKLGAPLEIEAP
jgi:hypothetical protein